ncbi:hypothetical protein H0901_10150 [Microcystis aeruginosa BLCCF158]|uniref:Uncharacterized protein n=1 Tax=Microcystis aeruginosa BLCC-F158 TaxID=2755316 RepID=A0A841V4G6_MICAE|nr:hypothetical protein [Microcystis aeruginosa]MBC1195617.1 hypothetical protein [Microcystis aeruginosa BLCC-F158]
MTTYLSVVGNWQVASFFSTLGLTQGNPTKGHGKRSPIQTDLGVGCWVSLSPKIERFSLTY